MNSCFFLLGVLLLFCMVSNAQDSTSVPTYRIYGDGEDVVFLLSGGPGLASNYLDSMALAVSQWSYKAVVVDQQGTSDQPFEAVTLTLANAVQEVDDLRRYFKKEKITLIGHSWGGMLAMAYATTHPTHCEKAVLVGPGGYKIEFFDTFSRRVYGRLTTEESKAISQWQDSLTAGVPVFEVAQAQRKILSRAYLHDKQKNHDRFIKESLAIAPLHIQTYRAMMNNLRKINYDLTEALKNIDTPMAIIQGESDPVGQENALEIHELVKNSRLYWIGDCGHYPWIEQEAAFYTLLRISLKY